MINGTKVTSCRSRGQRWVSREESKIIEITVSAASGPLESATKGLETVIHKMPSTVGIDTIYKSRGKIPEAFLRGRGLQNWEIEIVKPYRPDLTSDDATAILYRV